MNMHKTKKDERLYKVFIVDDHAVVRQGISKLINLEKDLYVCGDAEDIETAMQDIEDCRPDIVLVDLILESGSGIRLIEFLQNYHKNLPVLVLSMHDEFVYAERCLKAGARGYIMKKVSSEEIISAIRKILKGEIYLSDKLRNKFVNRFIHGVLEREAFPVDILSNRELEIYQLLGKGLNKREISENLNLSVKTVETHKENIKAKLKFRNGNDLLINAVRFVNNV